jgi:hypothetical protein
MKVYSIMTGEWLEEADATTMVADDDASRSDLLGGHADPSSALAAPSEYAPTHR